MIIEHDARNVTASRAKMMLGEVVAVAVAALAVVEASEVEASEANDRWVAVPTSAEEASTRPTRTSRKWEAGELIPPQAAHLSL